MSKEIVIYLHAHDVPGYGTTFKIDKRKGRSYDVKHLQIGAKTPAEEIAIRVADECDNQKAKLRALVFNSHGEPGRIKIGEGIGVSTAKDFEVLKGWFSDQNSGIDIHACNVAASGLTVKVMRKEAELGTAAAIIHSLFNDVGQEKKGAGTNFMVELAKATGVAVDAPFQVQVASIEVGGVSLTTPTGQFRGNWARAWPDGVVAIQPAHRKVLR